MISEPRITPITLIQMDVIPMLCGISCRNDIESMIPAENDSMFNITNFEGFFSIPKKEPIIGPRTEITNMNISMNIHINIAGI